MKKYYFLIYMCLMANLLNAQVNSLVIKFTDGNKKNVLISNVKGITFPTTTMNLYVFDGESEVFNKADIQKMYFETTTATPRVIDNQNNLLVYPNPTRGLIYFRNLPNQTSNVHIFNMSGVHVFAAKVTSSVQSMDVSFLVQGIYFISIDNQLVKLIKL
jgi:hypothetical protein